MELKRLLGPLLSFLSADTQEAAAQGDEGSYVWVSTSEVVVLMVHLKTGSL